MPDKNFIFANIVSTPTAISWSQTYNAGKLFSVLSLSKNGEEEIEELNVLGKDALEILEKEFFSLEEKSLASIKEVTLKASENLPQENISFLVAAFSEDILYLVIIGAGKVDIKRDVSIGTLLESKLENKENIKFASGFIKDKDTVILQTKQFSEAINSSTLAGSLESEPNEIVESLAPIIHEKEDGGAAAVIIRYKSVKEEEGEEIIKEYEPEEKREFLEKKSEEIKEEEFE
ncbi:hypothetical protein KKG52_01070, partial [Patescibacteria group bacterium]|nr:hypothetical protein [Patescibacteria group bacterium]